jgi:hypothetical protein
MSGFTGHEVATKVTPTQCEYHSTVVAELLRNGRVRLRTGGWHTVTTKRRMNQFAEFIDAGFVVYQKDFAWFVSFPCWSIPDIPFEEGMVV